MVLAERTFSAADQARFAALTGDRNPMHMDAAAARRTQAGAPVVHGMNAALWTLEELVRQGVITTPFATLKIQFHKFTFVDMAATLRISRQSETSLQVALDCAGVTAFTLTLGAPHRGHDAVNALSESVAVVDECNAPNLEEMANLQGRLPALDPTGFTADYPALAALVGAPAVRSLAQLSTLVGMVCPGLNSIFAGLVVKLDPDTASPQVTYRVENVEDRFRMIEIAVAGGGIVGTVTAFVRHAPIEQPSMQALAGRVASNEFAATTALVIGGSRGLGSVTARLLALGGARVIVTWVTGEAEAIGLSAEIQAYVGPKRCEVRRYDALAPAEAQLTDLGWPVDQMYYFATSRIFRQKAALYQPSDFLDFSRVYVNGFQAAAEALHARTGTLTAFYPSSVAVEEHSREMVEYSMAKAAGEMLCADLNRFQEGMRVVVKRLPRILTDQTATVATVASRDPIEVMLPLVREMHAGGYSSEPLPKVTPE